MQRYLNHGDRENTVSKKDTKNIFFVGRGGDQQRLKILKTMGAYTPTLPTRDEPLLIKTLKRKNTGGTTPIAQQQHMYDAVPYGDY